MKPILQIATSPGHFAIAKKLIESEGLEPVELKFPTILAFEPDRLVGLLGTHYQDDLIIAGPLVLQSDYPRLRTALALCEAYEHAMRTIGIKSFIMHVDKGNIMHQAIERYQPPGLEQYASKGDTLFYIRRL